MKCSRLFLCRKEFSTNFCSEVLLSEVVHTQGERKKQVGVFFQLKIKENKIVCNKTNVSRSLRWCQINLKLMIKRIFIFFYLILHIFFIYILFKFFRLGLCNSTEYSHSFLFCFIFIMKLETM